MSEQDGASIQALDILIGKMLAWTKAAVAAIPNLLVAAFVMLAFWMAARLAARLIRRLLSHTSESATVTRLIATTVKALTLFFGLFTTLGILNLDKTVTSLLAGAGVIGLAIGFAFQEIAANFFAGILIALRKPYREGDIVRVEDFVGRVSRITLRTTDLATFDGLAILVPNKMMFTKPVTNYTLTPGRRVELDVGVSYSEDLRKVEKVVREAVKDIGHRIPGRETEFFYLGFGESSINFRLRFWIDYTKQADAYQAVHLAVIAIKEAFDRDGITIPFPIRTIDFGLKEAVREASP